MSRAGARHIGSFAGQDGRIEAVPIDSNLFYVALFTDRLLTIASIFGGNPATNYVSNPQFNDGASGWAEDSFGSGSSVSFAPHLTTLTTGSSTNDFARISQEVTVPAPGTYTVLVTSHGNDTYSIKAGTGVDDDTYGSATTDAIEGSFEVTVPGTTLFVTVEVNEAITDGAMFVEVGSIGVTDDPSAHPDFVTPYADGELADLYFVGVPSGEEIYILHSDHAPQKLTYTRASDSFTFAPVVFTNPPSTWVAGNYPSVGTHFEGRLWVGSTHEERQTVWGSRSGLPDDFTVGTGLDDESITITMDRQGRIEWIEGFKNLLIGTENGEHLITSEGGVLTPDDHEVNQQSAYGSANIASVLVGDQAFYVSADGRKLRAMQYEWAKDNYLSTDLTYFSEHITAAGIKEIAWQQNPNNVLWCLLKDGTTAALSYDRSNNIYGWSKHDVGGVDDNGDRVVSIATGSVHGADIIVGLVERAPGVMCLESQQSDKNFYMDAWKDFDFNGTPTDTVAGLDHLEGREVQVLVSRNSGDARAVHPNKTVSGGSITLDYEVAGATAGLQIDAHITLLPFEKGAQLGTSAPYWKNFNQVHVHLLDSALPLVNGKRSPSRVPSTPMGTPSPNTTGKSYINLTGWKNETDITISQDLPKQLIVLAVSGEIAQEKL